MSNPGIGPVSGNNPQFSVNSSEVQTAAQRKTVNTHMQFAVVNAMKELVSMNIFMSQKDSINSQESALIQTLFDPLKSAKTLSSAVSGLKHNLTAMEQKISALQQEVQNPGLSSTKKGQLQNEIGILNGAYHLGQRTYTSLNDQMKKANQAFTNALNNNSLGNIRWGVYGSQSQLATQYYQEYNADNRIGLNDGSVIAKKQNDTAGDNLTTAGNSLMQEINGMRVIGGVLKNLADSMMNTKTQ